MNIYIKGQRISSEFILTILLTVVTSFVACATCFASTVALQWDASADAGLAGYKVYYQSDSPIQPFTGTGAAQGASPVSIQNQTSATISGLDPSRSYYFAVTAHDTSGVESNYSNIVHVPELVPPVTSITFPVNNTTVSGTISLTASSTDNVGVTKVEFYVNGALQATDTAVPYVYSWNTSSLAAGPYTLMAKAYDAAGNIGQSSNVVVTVVKDTIAPVVSLSAPGNNSTVSGNVAITVSAHDNIGVSSIEYFLNGILLSASNVAPYTFNWNTTSVANGSYILTGRAYDNAGNMGQSSNVSVTVNNVNRDITLPGSTVFTIIDALLALQIGSGQIAPTAGVMTRLDVAPVFNGTSVPNGVVDTGDAIAILSIIVGKLDL